MSVTASNGIRKGAASELFQRKFKLRSAREPGAMHTITGAVDVAAPNAFKTESAVAAGPKLDIVNPDDTNE